MKKWIKPILVILAIVMLFIGANSIFIYKYLSEYGYGIKELPQTVAVWLRLSDGFTVEVNDDGDDSSTLFIGHSDLLYYLRKYENKGYEVEQMGSDVIIHNYKTEGDYVGIGGMEEWCHWFRVYCFSSDEDSIVKIENMK